MSIQPESPTAYPIIDVGKWTLQRFAVVPEGTTVQGDWANKLKGLDAIVNVARKKADPIGCGIGMIPLKAN